MGIYKGKMVFHFLIQDARLKRIMFTAEANSQSAPTTDFLLWRPPLLARRTRPNEGDRVT